MLTQGKHCDMEQFNQQKAENREEDKRERQLQELAWEAPVYAEWFWGLREEECAVHLGLPARSKYEV